MITSCGQFVECCVHDTDTNGVIEVGAGTRCGVTFDNASARIPDKNRNL